MIESHNRGLEAWAYRVCKRLPETRPRYSGPDRTQPSLGVGHEDILVHPRKAIDDLPPALTGGKPLAEELALVDAEHDALATRLRLTAGLLPLDLKDEALGVLRDGGLFVVALLTVTVRVLPFNVTVCVILSDSFVTVSVTPSVLFSSKEQTRVVDIVGVQAGRAAAFRDGQSGSYCEGSSRRIVSPGGRKCPQIFDI